MCNKTHLNIMFVKCIAIIDKQLVDTKYNYKCKKKPKGLREKPTKVKVKAHESTYACYMLCQMVIC